MKHHVDVSVGQQIRRRRWMVGMTQQQLGDAVGIKFQQIQKYETGMNRVSASRLWEIANALDAPVAFFFEEVTDADTPEAANDSAPATTDFYAEKETADLVRCYYALPEEPRRRLFELTKSLIKAA